MVRLMLRAFDALRLDADAIHAHARPRLHAGPVEGAEGAPPFLSEMAVLWDSARAVSGQSGLGVRLAELPSPLADTLFGKLIVSATTLGEALVLASRSMRLIQGQGAVQLSIHVSGDRASVSVARLYRSVPHDESLEYILSSLWRASAGLAGVPLPLSEVTFAHDRPRDATHHERVFAAPVRWGAVQNAYYFDSEQLLLPLSRGDLTLRQQLQGAAARVLRRAEDPADFRRVVRAAIERELQRGDASVSRVAERLGLHPKAFARRLTAQALSFRELLDGVRYELADQHLRSPEARVGQVARLLGYSEKSAFNRAFKRWAGRSPQAFRDALGLSTPDD
jgi:AraC-like DNA-binding protein